MVVKRTTIKKFLEIILICLISIIIALGITEFYLRRTSSYVVDMSSDLSKGFIEHHSELLMKMTPKGRRMLPNAHVILKNHSLSKRDIAIDTNSLGYRDIELPKPKRKNEYRILVLGDSITCGNYVDADQVFVKRLEYYLRQSTQNMNIEVINSGVEDFGTKEEIDLLEESGLSLEPDMVILEFYLNDSRPPWGFDGELGHRGWLRRHSVLANKIYGNMVMWNWVEAEGKDRFRWLIAQHYLDWSNNPAAFLELVSLANYDWGAAWDTQSWEMVKPQFKRLESNSEKNHFPVVVVDFPVVYQLKSSFPNDTPQKELSKNLRQFPFKNYDLLPLLREHSTENLYYDHCHPNVMGNDIIGKAIADYLLKEQLIKLKS